MRILHLAPYGFCLSLVLGLVGAANAQKAVANDPSVGGQNNRCWGEIASQLAKLGMGPHSRSQTAADNVGGFNNSDNPFGIHQQTNKETGNAGRTGVGNVSAGAPHFTNPGDGGNGQHAVNNGEFFTQFVDPVTGALGPSTALTCAALEPNLP
jgi:hypothetical protein